MNISDIKLKLNKLQMHKYTYQEMCLYC